MELEEVVRRRHMVRSYTDAPIPDDVLLRILGCARRAPSAGNAQPVRFVVVRSPVRRSAVAGVCGEEQAVARGLPRWLSTAPVLVVPCVEPEAYVARYAEADKLGVPPHERTVPWQWVDGGQALMLLLLATVDEGLGAGLLDVEDRAGLRALLGIPEAVEPLGVVTIGVPATGEELVGSALRHRPPLADVVHEDRWRPAAEA